MICTATHDKGAENFNPSHKKVYKYEVSKITFYVHTQNTMPEEEVAVTNLVHVILPWQVE